MPSWTAVNPLVVNTKRRQLGKAALQRRLCVFSQKGILQPSLARRAPGLNVRTAHRNMHPPTSTTPQLRAAARRLQAGGARRGVVGVAVECRRTGRLLAAVGLASARVSCRSLCRLISTAVQRRSRRSWLSAAVLRAASTGGCGSIPDAQAKQNGSVNSGRS